MLNQDKQAEQGRADELDQEQKFRKHLQVSPSSSVCNNLSSLQGAAVAQKLPVLVDAHLQTEVTAPDQQWAH